MKKLNIKDINVKFHEYPDVARLIFETKDGTPVDWIETRNFEGFVTDDDAMDMVQEHIRYCFGCLKVIYDEDEETWEAGANKQLEDIGVKLGAYHDKPNGHGYYSGYYELESL